MRLTAFRLGPLATRPEFHRWVEFVRARRSDVGAFPFDRAPYRDDATEAEAADLARWWAEFRDTSR